MTIDRVLLLFLIGHLASHAEPQHPILAGVVAIVVSYASAAMVSWGTTPKRQQ